MKTETVLLNEAQVADLIDWKRTVRIAEELLREQGKGNVLMPPKLLLDLRSRGLDSYSNAMPAYIEYLDLAGIKWGGGYGANNISGELPYMMQVAILNNPHTGEIYMIMGATWLTSTKTGAESALAGKYLGVDDDLIVTVLGAGVQGRASVHSWLALNALGDISVKELRIVDLERKTAEKVAAEARDENPRANVRVIDSIQEGVEGAHAVVSATTATEPIVERGWLRDDVVMASIGSFGEFERQAILDSSKLVVDSWEQNVHRGEFKELIEAGKITRDDIHGEFPEIIAGKIAGREPGDGMIAASLIGLGSVDLAIAYDMYETVKEEGIGTKFSFI